ncbi:MAG: hypothetical protein ACRDHN_13130, partial [Thermomicrobiales bacterium]
MAFLLNSFAVSADEPPRSEKDDKQPAAMNCSDGELRVGDLKGMDNLWQLQQPQLDSIAKAWEADAVLTGLRVSCGILE